MFIIPRSNKCCFLSQIKISIRIVNKPLSLLLLVPLENVRWQKATNTWYQEAIGILKRVAAELIVSSPSQNKQRRPYPSLFCPLLFVVEPWKTALAGRLSPHWKASERLSRFQAVKYDIEKCCGVARCGWIRFT